MAIPSENVQLAMMREFSEPTFILTMDIDWASEYCIKDTISWLRDRQIIPGLFLTHHSSAIEDFLKKGAVETAVHPNFLAGSTHGETVSQVFDTVLGFSPSLSALRSHSYVESSPILSEAAKRGIEFDSNNCLFLQSHIYPLRHWTGIWRLPVFWEDDVHWCVEDSWRFSAFRDAILTPGLKIIDVHPFIQALNIPNADFYERHKRGCQTIDLSEIRRARHDGEGARTFLGELIDAVHETGRSFCRLSSVMDRVRSVASCDRQPR